MGSHPGALNRLSLLPTTQRWFWQWAVIRLCVLLVLGHWYDVFVFHDVSKQLASGHGVYAISSIWLAENGDGYYAYPPVFAYFLALAGLAASLVGGHWYAYHVAIKLPLLVGDLATFCVLRQVDERAAKRYWTLWFVPILAIAQIQPDIWAGLLLLLAYLMGKQERWSVAGGLIGLAAAVKFIPVVIIPFIVVHLWHRSARSNAALFAAYAFGAFIAAWLPYVVFYQDAWQFRQVLEFHAARTGGGLNLITPITFLYHLNQLLTGALGSSTLILAFVHFVSEKYLIVTAGVIVLLLITASLRSWTVEQSFLIPIVGVLISNRLVHEQYLMQIIPLALVAAPELVAAVFWPFSVYVLAAGTPLRFIPRELNPIDLAGFVARPIIVTILTFVMSLAVIMFIIRLGRAGISMMTPRPYPLLRIARQALIPIAAALVLVMLVVQRPSSTAMRLEVYPGGDVIGNGTITLLPVYVQNSTDRELTLKFVIGHDSFQTVWLPSDGSNVTLPPNSARLVDLLPRQFDRGIPINTPFRVRAIAEGEDLAAEVSVATPQVVRSSKMWHTSDFSAQRLPGSVLLSRGAREQALISTRCIEQRLALRMTVKRDPQGESEWTAAEIKYELNPPLVKQIFVRGFSVWVHNPLAYQHDSAGWPTALQSVELRDEHGSALTLAFSRATEGLYDLSANRRVVVLRVLHDGWSRVHFEFAEHARDLGWSEHSRLTLSFMTATHFRNPGFYEAYFGLMDPSGGLSTCVTPEGASQSPTSEK